MRIVLQGGRYSSNLIMHGCFSKGFRSRMPALRLITLFQVRGLSLCAGLSPTLTHPLGSRGEGKTRQPLGPRPESKKLERRKGPYDDRRDVNSVPQGRKKNVIIRPEQHEKLSQ